jgi:hypothetical protein
MIDNLLCDGKNLTILQNGISKVVHLETSIWMAIHTDSRVIVLLDTVGMENSELYNRNIICIDDGGSVLWRIEDPDLYRSGKIKTKAPFTSIRFKDDKLIGFTWDGFDIPIDINTGKLSKEWDFTK